MTLPVELASIFHSKQKSYKMVLIQSILDEYNESYTRFLPLNQVAERFLSYYQNSSVEGKKVDSPPNRVASSWDEFTLSQTKSLLKTPIDALSEILEITAETITFKHSIWEKLNDDVLKELIEYAQTELTSYNSQLVAKSTLSLQESLTHILNDYVEAKTQLFAGHPLGKLFRNSFPEYLQTLPIVDDNYKVQGSIGQGNWANIPWIAILDKRITKTTQHGEYIVYLFAEDMSSVYLTLNQGVTVPIKDHGRRNGYRYLEQKVEEMRELLPLQNLQKDENIQLTSSGLGRDYQVSTVAYVRYDRNNIPNDEQLLADLANMLDNYKLYADHVASVQSPVDLQITPDDQLIPQEEEVGEPVDTLTVLDRISRVKTYINNKGFRFPEGLIENLYLSLKTKPFVILAGVSGTGKTKLVKLFAEALGAVSQNNQFALIPVRPDWSDPSDLLGYKDLSGVFRPGHLAEVLVEASKPDNQSKPYFICLDEMNLARVEYYFSDLLSIIETQEWKGDRIVTMPLINKDTLATENQSIYGNLSLPDNVYLIGTVNMDETTHPFSKKVLDRANTIEFNYIDLMQFPDQVEPLDEPASVQASNALLRSEYLQLIDAYGEHQQIVKNTTAKLAKVNDILEQIHSHVGFRIRDAVCFYMIYNERFGLLSEDEAFDLQLSQKILPRVQGSSSSVKRVLLLLMQEALGKRLSINTLLDDASEIYMKWSTSEQEEAAKYPLSARKIAFMLRRLEEDGFTSYWLS